MKQSLNQIPGPLRKVILDILMTYNIKLNGEISRDILQDFAKYIIPYIRDFTYSDEGKHYISMWMRNHPEYEEDDLWFMLMMKMMNTMKTKMRCKQKPTAHLINITARQAPQIHH